MKKQRDKEIGVDHEGKYVVLSTQNIIEILGVAQVLDILKQDNDLSLEEDEEIERMLRL